MYSADERRVDRRQFLRQGGAAAAVALDATLDSIISAKRGEKGMSPHQVPTTHIGRAAELGVGEADIGKIKRLDIEV